MCATHKRGQWTKKDEEGRGKYVKNVKCSMMMMSVSQCKGTYVDVLKRMIYQTGGFCSTLLGVHAKWLFTYTQIPAWGTLFCTILFIRCVCACVCCVTEFSFWCAQVFAVCCYCCCCSPHSYSVSGQVGITTSLRNCCCVIVVQSEISCT